MEGLAEEAILAFLEEVGKRYSQPADLLLLGGSALCLLGSPRPTLDIDYIGDDLTKNELQQCIDQVAQDMGIMVEAVPIAGFVPLPEDADQRKVSVGRFGSVWNSNCYHETTVVRPYLMTNTSPFPGTPQHQALLQAIVAFYEHDARVLAVIVFGSLGRGGWDVLSDIDLDVVVADDAHMEVVDELRRLRASFAPLGELSPPPATIHQPLSLPGGPSP